LKEKIVSEMMFLMLMISMLSLAINIKPARSDWTGTVHIRADGSIDPPDAPIITYDNITYTLTDNITSFADGIIVERDSVTINGANFTLYGSGSGIGINISGRTKVKIKNLHIQNFEVGIKLYKSNRNTIYKNNLENNILRGILAVFSDFNIISENNITNSYYGVLLFYSRSNNIHQNNIANNSHGIGIDNSFDNQIYHNNFFNNTQQVHNIASSNIWDNGYPSGGNYWSNYIGVDIKRGPNQDQHGSDGIGDTSYIIDVNNTDRYPLMYPYGSILPPNFTLTITATSGGTTDPPPGTYVYFEGQNVSVEAMPFAGYIFHHWELDGINVGDLNPITVTIRADHHLHAVLLLLYNITIRAHCINEGIDVNLNITMDGSLTGYQTPHTFTSLAGMHTFTLPQHDVHGHQFRQWSIGERSTTINVTKGGTYIAYYRTPPVHAIGITEVTALKNAVGQNCSLCINVTAINPGDYVETFNLTVYANMTELKTKLITLQNGSLITVAFNWNTTGFVKGNYNVWAYAEPVPGETDTEDNIYVDGVVWVRWPYDVTGDGYCGIDDIVAVAEHFGAIPGDPNWNPIYDITCNNYVGIDDIVEMADHFGQTGP